MPFSERPYETLVEPQTDWPTLLNEARRWEDFATIEDKDRQNPWPNVTEEFIEEVEEENGIPTATANQVAYHIHSAQDIAGVATAADVEVDDRTIVKIDEKLAVIGSAEVTDKHVFQSYGDSFGWGVVRAI